MYATTDLVIEGALEESETFYDETLLREYVYRLREELAGDGVNGALYVIWHEHEPTLECLCVQYLQDHQPYETFGEES